MSLFETNPDHPRRGLFLVSGLVALGAIALFAVVLVRRGDSSTPTKKVKRKAPSEEAVLDARPDPVAQKPVAPPSKEASPVQVQRTMDQSNARNLVRTLMEAAALGDPTLKKGMISAIGRYGDDARPILLEELNRAQPPDVRKALEEALVLAK